MNYVNVICTTNYYNMISYINIRSDTIIHIMYRTCTELRIAEFGWRLSAVRKCHHCQFAKSESYPRVPIISLFFWVRTEVASW